MVIVFPTRKHVLSPRFFIALDVSMLIVINDFIPNIDEVTAHADKLTYYSDTELNDGSRFAGVRTKNVISQFPRIHQSLSETFRDIHFRAFQCHKHRGQPERILTHTHTDGQKEGSFAGVIYLRGGKGCGTLVGNKLVGFKRNRLVFYNSLIPHRPEGFPVDRMTISFFGRKQ